MRFIQLSWITTKPGRAWVGSISNKHNPSTKSGIDACISSRITTVIHVVSNHQINYNCFNEPFAVSPYKNLYWDMHGLIFETSIWLLAGSTRFVHFQSQPTQQNRSSLSWLLLRTTVKLLSQIHWPLMPRIFATLCSRNLIAIHNELRMLQLCSWHGYQRTLSHWLRIPTHPDFLSHRPKT